MDPTAMTDLTTENYRCLQKHCRHIGPAMMSYTTQSHGENATETVYEPECEKCGGNQLSETSGEVGPDALHAEPPTLTDTLRDIASTRIPSLELPDEDFVNARLDHAQRVAGILREETKP
jgi:hypothetical protein